MGVIERGLNFCLHLILQIERLAQWFGNIRKSQLLRQGHATTAYFRADQVILS